MNIWTTSWHYRLLRFFYIDVPSDLCRYARNLVLTLAAISATVISVPFGMFAVGMIFASGEQELGSAFVYVLDLMGLDGSGALTTSLMVVAMIIGALAWAMLALVIFGYCILYLDGAFDDGPAPAKQPGLISTWWRAKKDKICPLINFVEPPKEVENAD